MVGCRVRVLPAYLAVPVDSDITSTPLAGDNDGNQRLKRSLSLGELIGFGVGGTVGAGVFVISGTAAKIAGPAVVVSFGLACVACFLSALCYAEFVTRYPGAGSAYTYVYCTLGELPAFLVGCALTFEYALASSTIARSWASYVVAFSQGGLPGWLAGEQQSEGQLVNWCPLAAALVVVCGLLILRGSDVAGRFNVIVTGINVCLLVGFIAVGATYTSWDNWQPFLNPEDGWRGVARGAGKVFFSFIGFDAVTTLAEESLNPSSAMPKAISGTLGLALLLYCSTAAVLTGMVPFQKIDSNAPLAAAFTHHSQALASRCVAFGAITTTTSTTLCSLIGQPRILLRLASDGLLPTPLARIQNGTPRNATIVSVALAASLAGLVDFDVLADMISGGTLFVYACVCGAVVVARASEKSLSQADRAAASTLVFGTSFLTCVALMLFSGWGTWALLLTLVILIMLSVFSCLCACCATSGAAFTDCDISLDCSASEAAHDRLKPRHVFTKNRPFMCPCVPLIPLCGVAVNLSMLGSLGWPCLRRLLFTFAASLVFYGGYSFWNSNLRRLGLRGQEQASYATPPTEMGAALSDSESLVLTRSNEVPK